jgi:hypothetical protein
MEGVSAIFVFVVAVGLVFRTAVKGERARRRGPGTPARFVHFTGRRLKITTRSDG